MFIKKTQSDPTTIINTFRECTLNYKFSSGRVKSAGVIPYCYHNDVPMILLQRIDAPKNKKLKGWNDFGGKADNDDSVYDTAAREFSEETSGMAYVNECERELINVHVKHIESYDTEKIIESIIKSKGHYVKKLKNNPEFIYLTNSYVSFLMQIDYIDINILPPAEDMHIPYTNRYYRTCKWFRIDELMRTKNSEFHRRLTPSVLKAYLSHGIFKR